MMRSVPPTIGRTMIKTKFRDADEDPLEQEDSKCDRL